MRAVVTGAAGFLGSHVCELLVDRGDEVVGVDNLCTGALANLRHLEDRPGFTFTRSDVCDRVDVAGPVDAVMHLASPASPKDYLALPVETLKAGSIGTLNTLDLARAKGARYFLASTSEVYGDPEVDPQPETYWGHVNPNGPRAVYDEAKRFAEATTMAYHRAFGVDVGSAARSNTYGPGCGRRRPGVVSNLLVQAQAGEPLTVYGNGACWAHSLDARPATAFLFITHDLAVARYVSDRNAVIHEGRLVESGETDSVIAEPQDDYTRTLLAASEMLLSL